MIDILFGNGAIVLGALLVVAGLLIVYGSKKVVAKRKSDFMATQNREGEEE